VPSDFSLAASVCSKPVEFTFAAIASSAIASSPSLATAARTKSANLNAVCSKHSVAALASWSSCPCYETNVLVYVPQALVLDLAAAASVIAALANVAIANTVFSIHVSNPQTLAASAFVNRHRIAQHACTHRSQAE
jgi:hypothetical protein